MATTPKNLPDWDEQASHLMNYRNLLDEVDNMLTAAANGWDGVNKAQQKVLNMGQALLTDGRDLLENGKLTEDQFKRRVTFTRNLIGMDQDLSALKQQQIELEKERAYYAALGNTNMVEELDTLLASLNIEKGRQQVHTRHINNLVRGVLHSIWQLKL